jgi:uncharacterized protein
MKRGGRILELLGASDGPLTGAELAAELGVSRQVIVQDVAILRAAGHDIMATPQGYVMAREPEGRPHRARVAVRHPPEKTADELNTFVDHRVRVIDVIVEHPLYGDLIGALMLKSRDDVARFMKQLRVTGAPLLSSLTGGLHLHTVEFDRVDDFKRAEAALASRGFLAGDAEE